MLEILSESERPMSILQLAEALDVHRSIAYRILRTLESHGLVKRNESGQVVLGARLATLARSVSRTMQAAALPRLSTIANRLEMTAFLAVLDGSDVVTLVSVEPIGARLKVAQRPGTHHPVVNGAPGIAIHMALGEDEWRARFADESTRSPAEIEEARQRGYATSHDEVIPGLASVAVPLIISGQQPAALAVVYVGTGIDPAEIGRVLTEEAAGIRDDLGV